MDPDAPGEPLAVLHVLAPAEFGGLESVVRLLAAGLRERSHDVYAALVVERETDGRGLEDALVVMGVGVTRLVLPAHAYLREREAIATLCRRLRPDVVHTHGHRPDLIDAGVARRLGSATVTTAHGFTGGSWRTRIYGSIQRRAMRRFDAVVAVSRPLGDRLAKCGVPRELIHVLPNAYAPVERPIDRGEARRALWIDDDRFVAGWVGRLSREKGGDVLVDAAARLRDVAVHFSMIGDGPERSLLEQSAAFHGVGDRFTWHGRMPDAARLFPALDALVLSSRTEGTPIVLLEAMAAGIPVVATRVGGVPDVVSSAEALLVPAEDPGALAAAIRQVVTEPGAAQVRARAARIRLERDFGVAPWIDYHERIYRSVRRAHAPVIR